MSYVLLTVFHLAFFRRLYFIDWDDWARGEFLELEFASWVHLGRQPLFAWHIPDPYFWPQYEAQPILGTFYPPHRLSAWLTRSWPLPLRFRLFSLMTALHWWGGSLWLVSLLQASGWPVPLATWTAITTFGAAAWQKLNCSVIATAMWSLLSVWSAMTGHGPLSGISLGMSLLAGYWPLVLVLSPAWGLAWWRHS